MSCDIAVPLGNYGIVIVSKYYRATIWLVGTTYSPERRAQNYTKAKNAFRCFIIKNGHPWRLRSDYCAPVMNET